MKVLVDTNIFIASMRYVGLKRKLVWKLLEQDVVVVVTDFILEELREKFAGLYQPEEFQAALDNFLQFLGTGKIEVKIYEAYAPYLNEARVLIVEKDAPILAAAMLPDIDYLITRDKRDFLENPKLQGTPWIKKIKSPQELLALL
ncbi:MAG: putative toxin-antitoxin system toxin component, PIN family [Candidatus Bipolaricaulia bacterium]